MVSLTFTVEFLQQRNLLRQNWSPSFGACRTSQSKLTRSDSVSFKVSRGINYGNHSCKGTSQKNLLGIKQLHFSILAHYWCIQLHANQLHAERGIATSDFCPRCNSATEDLNQGVCVKSKEIWDSLQNKQPMRRFDSPITLRMTGSLWIWNLLNSWEMEPPCLGTLFLSLCFGSYGKIATKKSFENIDKVISVSFKAIVSYAHEIVEAFKSPLITGYTHPILIHLGTYVQGTSHSI